MKTNQKLIMGLFALVITSFAVVGCKKTAGQKIEDKVEDAGHEINQGVERAGENVKDATSK